MNTKKATKRALLTSVMALVMCVVMLVGTTFAWFTDTVSTGVNKIQAGNLDIELQMKEGNSWVPAEGKTLQFKKAAGHESEEVLWEPGCRYELPELRIVNKGNLALKYKITVNGVTGDAKLLKAIDFTAKMGGTEIALDSLNDAILPSGAAPTLAGEAVGATDPITIKGVMKTTAGNEYQGLSIDGIGITVVATQYTYEYDSKDNLYDKDADATIQVNSENIQDYLDGKYGSINGMTLVLAGGDYDRIEFGRATAYAGSNTKYYLKGAESTPDEIKQAIDANPHGGAGTPTYVRSMSNVTLKAADNATVTINGLVAFGGQVNSTKWYSRDFVAGRVAEDNNTSYYIDQKWSNITFEGLTFTGGVNIEAYQGNTLIDNVKFDRCNFSISDDASNKANCIRLNVDGNQAKANNLVVTSCKFTDGYTAVLTDGMPNVTVTGSTFSGLTKHAISPMMNWQNAPGYGRITVTGNTFQNMSSERDNNNQPTGTILRMGKVGAGAVFTIQNNIATEGITLENSIKVNSLADGITYNISGNRWGGLTASHTRLDG
jgi:predicted ribosomally synthesized peptide with SipW-like signal peptide